MATTPRVVQAAEVAPMPWRNGGGQTRELLVWPSPGTSGPMAIGVAQGAGRGEAPAWRLRISMADVSRSGPFSAYSGVQRWFCVVDGAGVRLRLAGREHPVDAGSAPLQFSGDTPAHCELIDGPTRDLNLMTAGGAGLMIPATAGRRWSSAHAQRGLFTRVAGVWADERGQRLALPPQTLFWMEEAAGRAWEFLPGRGADRRAEPPSPGPAGWWLGYAPESSTADQ